MNVEKAQVIEKLEMLIEHLKKETTDVLTCDCDVEFEQNYDIIGSGLRNPPHYTGKSRLTINMQLLDTSNYRKII